MVNIQRLKEGEYRVNSLDEVPNLKTLIEELRGGRKLWIESTDVFMCLYSSQIWDECESEEMYAESCLSLFGDEDDEEELSILNRENDKGAVAAVTARILTLPDDFYQAIAIYGDKTSFLDGFIGTSFFTGKEMQSFISQNSQRRYIFENCSFNPQQAVALLSNSSKVDITFAGCSFDKDCHSLSTYSGLLLEEDTPRSGKLRFDALRTTDPFFLQNLSFVENMLLDKLVLSSFNFDEMNCRSLSEAKVNSLTLENCKFREGSEKVFLTAIRSGKSYATTLNVIGKEATKPWWSELLQAMASPQCALQTVCLELTEWSPNLCNALMDALCTNERLMELVISATPRDFGDQWHDFLLTIESHKTLQKVTMRPQSDTGSKWTTPLDDLFRKNQRTVFCFHSNDHKKSDWSFKWNRICLKLRFQNIPRLAEDGTRSFVLTSAMARYKDNTDLLYTLLKGNQNFISMPR